MKSRSIGTVGLAMVLSVCLIAGCNAQAWVDIAIKDAPVILQIVINILQIVDVAAVPQAQSAGSEAEKDLARVQQFLADYKAAQDPTAKNQALANLQAALTAANTDISSILAAVHIADPKKQAAITAAVGVALSTLLAIESLVPVASGKASVAKAVQPPSPSAVKKQYNAVIGGAYPSAVLH